MSNVYIPISSADQWKRLLAEPERQWHTGYSARTVAHSWLAADGFPPEVASLFSESGIPAFSSISPLIIIPEHQVPLPPSSGHPSQNDVFVLAKAADDALVSITVEGKVSESFDKTIGEWIKSPSGGKQERLSFLRQKLGLEAAVPHVIRYQLLHRIGSAIIEAKRFGAKHAAMVVHSFSQTDEWFADFQAFVSMFGGEAKVGELKHLGTQGPIAIYAGWARGDPQFLAA
jgi:hypothetical protein